MLNPTGRTRGESNRAICALVQAPVGRTETVPP